MRNVVMGRTMGAMVLLVAAVVAAAAELPPRFPESRISAVQWQQYLTEVLAIPGIERRDSERQITLTDAKSMTIYAFTQQANPAHPGVVVRVLVVGPAGSDIKRTGYFAGDPAAFERWWRSFDALDARVRDEARQ